MGKSTDLTLEVHKEDTVGDPRLACIEVSPQKEEMPMGTLIQKPNGSFTFHYGFHFIPCDPDDVPDSDAVVLEGVGLEGLHNHYAAEPEQNPLSVIKNKRWYRDLFKHWESKGGMRIFLVDIDLTLKSTAKSFGLPWVEGMAGLALLSKAKSIKPDSGSIGLSRRKFLIKMSQTLAGSYLLTPTLGYFSNGIEELNQVVHPELLDLILSFRNCLFAQKLDRIAQQVGGCPRITTIIGAAHTGIEDKILEPPEARLDYFKRINPRLTGEIAVPESLYRIAEMRYDASNNRWYRADLFEDQSLREVFQNI